MPLAIINPKDVLLLLGGAVLAVGAVIIMVLVLLYGLKKIFGDRLPNPKIELRSIPLFVLCALIAIFSLLVVVTDDERTDKVVAASIAFGALAGIGVNVKLIKLPLPNPAPQREDD